MPSTDVDNPNFQNEELFSGLNTSLSYVIGVFEINGTILFANAGMKRVLTTRPGEESLENLINPSWNQLVEESANDRTIIYEGIFTFNVNSKSYESLNGTAQRRDDRILLRAEYDVAEMAQVQMELVSLNSEVTNLQRQLAIKNSQLEKVLAELKKNQSMLIHSEKMNAMGQMVAGVAHEINNPIAFVTSNVHSLGKMAKDLVKAFSELEREVDAAQIETLTKSASQIHKEADVDFIAEDLDDLLETSLDGLRRVKKIVDGLRNFSRLDEAEYKLANLREGIESSLSLARLALRDRIRVSLNIDDDLPEIQCRPAELNQVFLNLIMNAAQAIQGTGHLQIQVTAESDCIRLVFADDGSGMTPDVQQNIFNPFFTTKPVGSGTGLGLSIAHKIITDGHQGTISVESQPGIGSTFIIKLPIK